MVIHIPFLGNPRWKPTTMSDGDYGDPATGFQPKKLYGDNHHLSWVNQDWLVVFRHPSEKYDFSLIGMIIIPNISGKMYKNGNQTTNQKINLNYFYGHFPELSEITRGSFKNFWPCRPAKQTPVAQWKRRHGAQSMTLAFVARWFRPGVHHSKVAPIYTTEPPKNPRNVATSLRKLNVAMSHGRYRATGLQPLGINIPLNAPSTRFVG